MTTETLTRLSETLDGRRHGDPAPSALADDALRITGKMVGQLADIARVIHDLDADHIVVVVVNALDGTLTIVGSRGALRIAARRFGRTVVAWTMPR